MNNFVAYKNLQEYSPWWHKNKSKYAFILLHFPCIIENTKNIKKEILLKLCLEDKSETISKALDN
jgi:TATA-binding protein-associated factor Taf7